MRYFDGATKVGAIDFATNGYGMPWGASRSWSNVVGYATNNNTHNGNGWFDTSCLISP